jgi:endonuclease YncB( thermonuclease family)
MFSLCSFGVKRPKGWFLPPWRIERQWLSKNCDVFKTGAVLAAVIFGPIPATLADDLTGQVSVVDGDTLEIHGSRIRLWGVDAPETTQLCRSEDSERYRCGPQAANELDAFIARRPVSCLPINLDRYGRTVATCSVGGTDLGEWLVQNGLALDWPQYSKGGGMAPFSVRPSKPGEGCGPAAMSNLGSIGSAFVPRGLRPIARMTRTLTHRTSRAVMPNYRQSDAWQDHAYSANSAAGGSKIPTRTRLRRSSRRGGVDAEALLDRVDVLPMS